jgi:glyoxylase-like metal-dependent hydrolase (beta-lactamase superfamily II)
VARARGRAAFVAALLLAAPGALLAQPTQDFSKLQIETLPVAQGVSMLVGSGGNIGVSTGPDGVLIVDDQFAPLHPKIAAAVDALKSGPVRFVLNTHWHFDHTGGNELFGRGGALLVAQDAVRTRLAAGQFSKIFNMEIPPAPAAALPVVTFSEDLIFHWNGDEIEALHAPNAHTDGDAIVHFRKANAMHMGDVFVSGRYPFIDLESGGSLSGVIAGCDRALAIADAKTRIIPGHGPLSGRDELIAYRDMLMLARERIEAAIAAGTSLEKLIADSPLADLDPVWGGGFVKPEAFLRSVYASLEAERK